MNAEFAELAELDIFSADTACSASYVVNGCSAASVCAAS
jgi:hypothetical protein